MFIIKEELKKLPSKPGVYLMKDGDGIIIYVGKAINLRNRVRQYFQSSANHTPKTLRLVSQIKEFEYIVTDSEIEALILECNLIKRHHPKYNVLLKDDKTYPYIKVTIQEDYPRIFLTRKVYKDKAKYFGPYTDVGAVRETLDLIHKIWRIRTCALQFPRDMKKNRPCLNYYIGQCDAPCQGGVSIEEYNKMVKEAIEFLNGKYEGVIQSVQNKMNESAEQMEFEKAAAYRDQIHSIKRMAQKQKMMDTGTQDQDVIAFALNKKEALVQVFFIRGGKLLGREQFVIEGIEETSGEHIMTSFIKQFYSGTPFIPKEIILQVEIEEHQTIEKWLSQKKGQKVMIQVPQKGKKAKLIHLALKNAELSLSQFGEKLKKEEKRTKGAVGEVAEALGIERDIKRIEAYDISNIYGYQSVGAMVVYEDGKPKRNDYRKFKIKTVYGANDYGSMEEVLSRRLRHALEEKEELEQKGFDLSLGKFSSLPDLMLIDGGKGQVSVVEKVLRQYKIEIPVCGMVKDDKHRTRGLLYHNQEIHFPTNSQGFHLITRIQDEVHRFAIEYHRKIREKDQVQSVLDSIPNIGKKRKMVLLQHFGSVEKIKQASIEELLKVEEINRRAAQSIYHFFHTHD